MIEKKVVYEVNGKTFEQEADAIRESNLSKQNDYLRVSKKFLEIINVINRHARVNIESELCSVNIDVKDSELLPEYYTTKTYSNAFRLFLKNLGVGYRSFEGDERKSGYLSIYTNKLIDDVPTEQETVDFIAESIEQIEKDFQNYLREITK